MIPNMIMNLWKNGKIHKDDEHTKAVWEKHGEHDQYMTMKEVRAIAKKHCPDTMIKRKLFWRYVLIWKKALIRFMKRDKCRHEIISLAQMIDPMK